MRRDFSFVAIVIAVIKFSAGLRKEHNMFIIAAQMVHNVKDMVSSDFLPAIVLENTSVVFGWRSFSFNALIFAMLLTVSTSRGKDLNHMAHISKIEPCPHSGKRINRFWFVLQASTIAINLKCNIHNITFSSSSLHGLNFLTVRYAHDFNAKGLCSEVVILNKRKEINGSCCSRDGFKTSKGNNQSET